MNIVQVNMTYKMGSTGKIMADLNDTIVKAGHKCSMVFAYSYIRNQTDNMLCLGKLPHNIEVRKDLFISRITGLMGYRNNYSTKKAIDWIKTKKPDIIHLHNIHGDWINLRILFNFIKECSIPVIWTLHDCWAFTGRCSHFELCGCNQWKTGCHLKCPNMKVYPISYFFDFSEKMWRDKKLMYGNLANMTIVTPSKWLANYVEKSFLGNYSIKIINNGINIHVYKPMSDVSDYLKKINGKKIILGVASSWSKTKGLVDFVELNKIIDHSKYQIVLVGLKPKQISELPDSIVKIGLTKNEAELASIYSAADVFVNMTYQDNYPTTNLEAMSCGTPAVTYSTGGSPESVLSKNWIVKPGDINQVMNTIETIVNCNVKTTLNIREQAISLFDKESKYREYLDLYEKLHREELDKR